MQLTNAGIDLAQLGLGGLLAEEEDTSQDPNRTDMDMGASSMASDFAGHGFGDDSQPDDMNLQAQSLIAALSALVPQSQASAESAIQNRNGEGTRDAPITIDLTDDPDDEPEPVPEPKAAGPQSEPVSTPNLEHNDSPADAGQEGSTSLLVSPETGNALMPEV